MRLLGSLLRRSAVAIPVVAGLITGIARTALACTGNGYEIIEVNGMHPDLPLDGYVSGRLGIIWGGFAPSYLVVAFRTLNGMPLDPQEQAGALKAIQDRVYDDVEVSPTQHARTIGATPDDPTAVWLTARTGIMGTAPAVPPGAYHNHYGEVGNCYTAAFAKAAETLADRVRRYGAPSPTVREWILAQDLVFANCRGGPAQIPAELSSPKDTLVAADRAYQIASAYFYALNYAEADKRFRAIGADKASPYRAWGLYLAARNATRQATSGTTPNSSLLAQAESDLEATLADGSSAPAHAAARAYLGYVHAHKDPEGAAQDVSIRLASRPLGADFGQALTDYAMLLSMLTPDIYSSKVPDLSKFPDSDRLSTWVFVLGGGQASAFDRAERLYQVSHSPVWLVAALMTAKGTLGARLDPLLKDADALPKTSPAYATATYHRLRLLLERGQHSGLSAEALKARALFPREDNPSTFNAFTALAARAAPNLDTWLENAVGLPAGILSWAMVAPSRKEITDALGSEGAFTPETAAVLDQYVSLATLKQIARSPKLPEQVRARVLAMAWSRAALLDDGGTEKNLRADMRRVNPNSKPFVDRMAKAKGTDERRLAIVGAMLETDLLNGHIGPWERGFSKPTGRMAFGRTEPNPTQPSFVSAKEVALAKQESTTVARYDDGAFLANEVARLAETMPKSDYLAKLLHLVIRQNRFGGPTTTPASKRAFEVLHRKYRGSIWAKKTKYYY